jgi:hypothetical protein
MSWDCPHWNNEICLLNGITCVPGKGQCVLKGRYEIKSGRTNKKNELKKNNSLATNDTKSRKKNK